MNSLIVIPARYASTRLPGKPLVMIAGHSLLERVINIAQQVAAKAKNVQIIVATDDQRIVDHAQSFGVKAMMTSPECRTGTDRVYEVMNRTDYQADFIINLQGDAPFTPPDFVADLIESFRQEVCDVVTPVTQLTWEQLDKLREQKSTVPFSGTCVAFNFPTGLAHWFSKNIIPAIRKEEKMREQSPFSPVWRHIGLYGFSRAMLSTFVELPEGTYEALEGLEQLRVLESGYQIRCVPVSYDGRPNMSGVDSPEDVTRAEKLIAEFGETFKPV